MYKRAEEKENGKQPEEIAMMPKRGWGSDGDVQSDEADTGCRPSCLQRLANPWMFIFLVALGTIGGDGLMLLLRYQGDALRRQFELDADTITWMVYSSEIACVISAIFLSVLAKRIHLPRALAISSAVLGIAGVLCVIPYLATKGDLVPAPTVLENETYSMEKFQMMAPSCIENKKAMAVIQKLLMEANTGANKAPKKSSKAPPPRAKAPEVMGMASNDLPDSELQNVTVPSTDVKTMTMPDFQKLATHPDFQTFVGMAKGMGIDLEAVAAMDLDGQIKYVEGLSPDVRAMLPNMKLMLGDNADSYFMRVRVDETGSHRVKRSTGKGRKGRINLETDMAYNGQMVKMMKMMPPIPPQIMEKAAKLLCPFNTGPFLVNSSREVVKIFNVAMVLQGIARGPRVAFTAMFLLENSMESSLSLHFGVLLGVSCFTPLLALMMSMYSTTMYLTLEDVGFMSMFNPRWLPAWWTGFACLAICSFSCVIPFFLFPRKLKTAKKYTIATTSGDKSCYSCGGYIKDLLASAARVFSNPVYLAVVLGSLFSIFPWMGVLHISFNYVTHQFQLEPFIPGLYLMSAFIIIFVLGIIVGGFVASKRKFSSLCHLKYALGLACCLVIIQACNLGFGCSQPSTDKGLRIVSRISNDTNCGSTCPCSDIGFSPACGSDGRTYYSPCHAGCGEGYDGKFHDCKCVEDTERTVTPGYCPNCDFYIPFFAVFCIGGFLLGLQTVPWFTAIFRSVKQKDVPIALGFLVALITCVVSIPSPVVYQTLEDAQCVGRIFECGLFNTCVRYNIENVRFHIFGLSLALQVVAALLFLVAFIFGRKSSIYHEQVYAKDQIKC